MFETGIAKEVALVPVVDDVDGGNARDANHSCSAQMAEHAEQPRTCWNNIVINEAHDGSAGLVPPLVAEGGELPPFAHEDDFVVLHCLPLKGI